MHPCSRKTLQVDPGADEGQNAATASAVFASPAAFDKFMAQELPRYERSEGEAYTPENFFQAVCGKLANFDAETEKHNMFKKVLVLIQGQEQDSIAFF